MKFLLTTFTLFLSIAASAQKDKGFNFPPDFGKSETTVLIRDGSKGKITEAMVEAFEKEYSGKFTQELSLSTKQKKDTAGYRYIFYVTEEFQPGQFVGKERFGPTTNYRFGMIDRVTQKIYRTEFQSGAYGKGAKYYVKNLEKFRKENGGE